MKVLFMGTPDFAAGVLEAIINSRHEVVCVVTQEDKPRGRSSRLVASPVKECAVRYNIPLFQPHRIKDSDVVEQLKKYEADIYVVAAYGQILSGEILDIPVYGCINTHASLLPKYRGAAPIQWAIADGEKMTGVTIMQMDEGLDTGDILYTEEVAISDIETGESLFVKLEECAKKLIIEALDKIESNDVKPLKQDETMAGYAPLLTKKMGEIDWSKNAEQIERLVRAFTPWPGTYTYFRGKLLKILEVTLISEDEIIKSTSVGGNLSAATESKEYGKVLRASKNDIYVSAKGGFIKINKVQPEGKKPMDSVAFMAGYKIESGEKFG
ncbi:MAG: methionyl-tRNA formyltransferase [Lachnospiraceae bacterium]|nr:methionyl-tRNA formyltransferase [Lachnospiraceae bacterium]